MGSKKSEEQTVFTYTNADDYYKKKQFARGEAFHNSVLSCPPPFLFGDGTGFSLGIAGEAGDESVMPLKRGPNGMLGVRAYEDGGGRTPSSGLSL
jgi:phage-related minor tail protein